MTTESWFDAADIEDVWIDGKVQHFSVINDPAVPPGRVFMVRDGYTVRIYQPQRRMRMQDIGRKVQNVLTSAVTWVTAVSVALAQVAAQIEGLSPQVTQGIASIVAIITIIRRVSPVESDERGLS